MFYLSLNDIKSDMKLFFADHFPLSPVLVWNKFCNTKPDITH